MGGETVEVHGHRDGIGALLTVGVSALDGNGVGRETEGAGRGLAVAPVDTGAEFIGEVGLGLLPLAPPWPGKMKLATVWTADAAPSTAVKVKPPLASTTTAVSVTTCAGLFSWLMVTAMRKVFGDVKVWPPARR